VIDRVAASVAATIEREKMLQPGQKAGVAVSGGADSVFLFHALRELGLAAAVLHVNHKLRGAESDADEEFVRELAGQCDLPFYATAAPVPAGNLEQEARRLRYDFFHAQIQAGHCGVVATGHTLDDQAETVFSRFMRGAGTAGLSAIRPATVSGIIRPLLDIGRDEIRSWLKDRNLTWREDRSNEDLGFLRNRIRRQHMPDLVASINPSLREVFASTANWARAEEDYWTAEIDRLEAQYFGIAPETVLIRTSPFLALPLAVQRRLLRRGIERVRGSLRSIDFKHVEAIRALMRSSEGSGRIQLPDLDVYRSFDWLRLTPIGFDGRVERNFEKPLLVPGRTIDPERRLALVVELVERGHVYNNGMHGLDGERCAGSLLLRNWRPGDTFQSSRDSDRAGADKIKTLFQEFRVPLWERRTWPVVTLENSIVWTRRFGEAGNFAAGPESRKILLIREVPDEVMESNLTSRASIEMKRAPHPQTGGSGAEVL
jgi:tRNA(Ile)-lysidine synthase